MLNGKITPTLNLTLSTIRYAPDVDSLQTYFTSPTGAVTAAKCMLALQHEVKGFTVYPGGPFIQVFLYIGYIRTYERTERCPYFPAKCSVRNRRQIKENVSPGLPACVIEPVIKVVDFVTERIVGVGVLKSALHFGKRKLRCLSSRTARERKGSHFHCIISLLVRQCNAFSRKCCQLTIRRCIELLHSGMNGYLLNVQSLINSERICR